jgi:hypothetical protein
MDVEARSGSLYPLCWGVSAPRLGEECDLNHNRGFCYKILVWSSGF